MFRTFFKTGLRSFQRNKIFSLINISGLAIGLSAALVIYLIVQHDFSYDKFHKDGDRIYRVTSTIKFPDLTINNSGLPLPTYKAVLNEATGYEAAAHFETLNEAKVTVVSNDGKSNVSFKKQKERIATDNNYFKIFKYKWLAGSEKSSLSNPNQLVLTADRAKVYFGNIPVSELPGRTIIYDDSVTATVSGIVTSLQGNTDFIFQEFLSLATIQQKNFSNQYGWDEWGNINSSSQLFVKLLPGHKPAELEKQLAVIRERYRTKDKENPNKKDDTKHNLQPLADIHFNADFDAFNNRLAHKPTLYGLLAVAAFLLLLGCINFINLTTAQASKRAKEIGIRKTMGSSRPALMRQFLGESFILTLIATLFCVALTPFILKIFADFIPEGIGFESLTQPHVIAFIILLMIAVTFIAGIYPAFFLTRFQPVAVLKNQVINSNTGSKAWLRKVLTTAQFTIAQFLVIATLIVGKQIHYSMNKDLGYNKDAIVLFNTRWDFFSDKEDNRRFVLLDKLRAIPEIQQVSLAGNAPASNSTSSSTFKVQTPEKLVETMVEVKTADSNFFNLYGIKVIAGRTLAPSDTIREYVINETYAKFLGFKNPADAVGQFIERNWKVPIVGVVADFHPRSTQSAIKPLAFSSSRSMSRVIHILLPENEAGGNKWKNTIAKIEKEYKAVYPEEDFNLSFFDETIAAFYKSEQNISRLLRWATGLCIFISCLGLLGLVIFTTNQRVKEIGVRKVLGATVVQIITLLSKDLLLLVVLAFVIASPVAAYVMNSWLQDYSYRTDMSWWVFAATIIGMLVIALLTLSLRTIKSASENPVNALRSE
ncbi:FtsX-like permease family protein [Pollutibacter soli]|uniref:FtsX-like permease family protein n=1 Tax=Pollutibacter soli TaxID=3034157 RepID=UPI00301356FD